MVARRNLTPDARRWQKFRLSCAGLCFLIATLLLMRSGEPPRASAADAAPARSGVTIVVPLPIVGSVDQQVKKAIDQALEGLPADGPRPVLILEFRPKTGQSGDGSELEAAYALARYLLDPKLSKVSTVAYLPVTLQGHALLPVLACGQIVMEPNAQVGQVVNRETIVDRGMHNDYEFVATQRLTIPWPLVQAMLNPELSVFKVKKGDQSLIVLSDELEKLKTVGDVKEISTLVDRDKPALFTGERLRELGFVTHLVKDRAALAAALQLPASAVDDDPSLRGAAKPLLIHLDGPVQLDKVNFITRTLQQRLQKGDVNFVCLEIDSAGGSLDDSMRLAQTLAELSDQNIRTVAFVPRKARGDAALLAIACDQLVVTEGAILGGSGEADVAPHAREGLAVAVRSLVEGRARGWSLPLALVDRELAVARYSHAGDNRVAYFCDEELAEQEQPDTWQKVSELPTRDGLTGRQADEVGLARFVVESFDELATIYHWESAPERLQANWAHLLVEYLAKPHIAGILLFIAFFTMSIELMTPGVGLAGFISGVCFLLYFWANVLQGTAGALEILLFVGGLACIAIEIFALPGLGAFGIGGVLMIISSVILASQTFVIPRNAYQFEQLPRGVMMATAACLGVIISLTVFRKYLHKAPVFNRMLLKPPSGAQLDEQSRREALVTFDHLLNKRGVTLTPLTPAGKARFGDQLVDVVSDGEFLPRGASVCVIEAVGNRVVVKGLEQV
ncbi:MAG TPA: NfeD family protein [Pirellulaceae bacterium]|nr:NfeD family protein [Pirellulaceae bacterium]